MIMVLGPGSYKKFHSQVSKSTIGSHADRKVWILSSHLGITLALVPIFLQMPKHSEMIETWSEIWVVKFKFLVLVAWTLAISNYEIWNSSMYFKCAGRCIRLEAVETIRYDIFKWYSNILLFMSFVVFSLLHLNLGSLIEIIWSN